MKKDSKMRNVSPFAFSGLLSVVDSATILCIRRRPATLPASSLDDLASRFGPRFSSRLFGGRSSVTFASGWQVRCTATLGTPNPALLLLLPPSHLFTALPVLLSHTTRQDLVPGAADDFACLGSSVPVLRPKRVRPLAPPTRSAHCPPSTRSASRRF